MDRYDAERWWVSWLRVDRRGIREEAFVVEEMTNAPLMAEFRVVIDQTHRPEGFRANKWISKNVSCRLESSRKLCQKSDYDRNLTMTQI